MNEDNSKFEVELLAGSLRLRALSGTCSPPVPQPCGVLPNGTVPMLLQRVGGVEALATRQVSIVPGEEYVALATTDDADEVIIAGGPLQVVEPGAVCSTADFDDFFTTTPPAARPKSRAKAAALRLRGLPGVPGWRVAAPRNLIGDLVKHRQ